MSSLGGQLRGDARQQDLTAVCERHQPGGPVHGRAEVVTSSLLGLAGVDADANLDRDARRPCVRAEPALHLDGGGRALCTDENAAAYPSPAVAKTWPPWSAIAVRTI